MRWLQGCLHAHSTYSDGSGTPAVILDAAHEANLDFFMLSDHNTLAAAHDLPSGRYGSLLWVVGSEISPVRDHYLAFGLTTLVDPALPPQAIIDRVAAQGALGIIAHPDDRGSRILRLPDYRWRDHTVSGFAALEIWNYMSDVVAQCKTVSGTVRAVLRPDSHLQGPPAQTLAWWDELQRSRRVAAVAGLDCHAYRAGRGIRLTVYPYARMNRTLRNHVWLDEEPDIPALLGAIARGQLYIANHALSDPVGFELRAHTAQGTADLGQFAAAPATFVARTPVPAELRLLRNGIPFCRSVGAELRCDAAEAGHYRLEVRLQGRPWIFTNPITLRDQESPAAP